MLDQLINYGVQQELEPEPGYKVKWVKWAIRSSIDGQYTGVSQLGDASLGKRNPGREFKKAPDLTQPQMVGGPKNCRHFLADALSVVTLFDNDKPSRTDLAKHEFFIDLLRQAAKEVSELNGLAGLLQSRENLDEINQALKEAGAKSNESATFIVNGRYPLESGSWHGWWNRWWNENCPLKLGGVQALDLISGQASQPLLSHYKVSGLAGIGGQPTGDALISFDKEAFQSYGLQSSANAAVSAQSAIAYSESLNHLIRKTGRNLAGIKVVHWFKERLKQAEDDIFSLSIEGMGNDDSLTAQDKAQKLLQAIRTGQRPDLGNNRYYAMSLSGAAGRVMLRDWMEGSFEELAASIDAWFKELSIVRKEGDGLAKEPKLIAVLSATVRDLDEIAPPQVASLYRCAIKRGQPFPRWALAKTVLRSRADVLRGESPRYTRMGLIKACLMRNPNHKGGEQLSPYLNEEHPEPAYHCGRLMAVYADLQKKALGDVGAGVVQRFYAAASVTPALILGRVARMSQFHLNKLDRKPWRAQRYEGQLASIWERIGPRLPATMSLEEQGLFALGYYQQLAYLRRPKPKDQQTAQSEANNSNDSAESADKE